MGFKLYDPSAAVPFMGTRKFNGTESTSRPSNLLLMPDCTTASYMDVPFFTVNGIIATLIAFSGSLTAWTIYNGLISYIIMGTLIIGELIFRYFYKRHHGLLADQP